MEPMHGLASSSPSALRWTVLVAALTAGHGCSVDRMAVPIDAGADVDVDQCTDNRDCDDGFSCTVDECQDRGGRRVCVRTAVDSRCSDRPAPATTCQQWRCDPAAFGPGPGDGCVLADVEDGTSCYDGDYCNGQDTCQGGMCTPSNVDPCAAVGRSCVEDADTCGCNSDDDCPRECGTLSGGGGTPGCKPLCDPSRLQCVGCLNDAQCDDGNPCTADSCDATSNTCVNANIDAGSGSCTLDGGSSSGVCDGAGGCVPCVDTSDGTDPGCSASTPHCNGTRCVECLLSDDCPASPVDCKYRSCQGGSCQFPNRRSGFVCNDDGGNVCDGAGNCVECVDDVQCSGTPRPYCNTSTNTCVRCLTNGDCDDRNDCTTDRCTASNTCSNRNVSAGTSCSGGVCDGAGACVECRTNTHCDDGNPCTFDTCSSGTCSNVNRMAGVSCPGGGVCDGAGACVECLGDGDCNDGNECTTDTCTASNTCSNPPVATGTSCSGGVCDGSGSCVPCLRDSMNPRVSPDSGCDATTPVCDTTNGTCVTCVDTGNGSMDPGCSEGTPACKDVTTCVQCTDDLDCSGTGSTTECDTTTNTCK